MEFKDNGDDMLDADSSENKDLINNQQKQLTLDQQLYNKLAVFAQPILNGSLDYMKLRSEGLEDLILETIGVNEFSLAKYCNQNGDSMRDPEITFTIDKENKSVYPISFLQDNMGIFYETVNVSPVVIKNLKQFMLQWFTNIKDQSYEPYKIYAYDQENKEEYGYDR